MIARVLKWIRTYRHFRPSQLAGRLVATVRRGLSLTTLPSPPADLTGGLHPRVDFLFHDPWNTSASLREGRVTFLSETRLMSRPWDWHTESETLLWRFYLHYFNYLHLLDPPERTDLCREWIEENSPTDGVGWHPYPTSLRIANWCRLLDESAPCAVQESLYQQAGYLARNVETYLSGNHLLENARALVLAGLYFGDMGEASDWLVDGLDIYRRELSVQVLPDGGHYERSPMYHAQVLVGCLDVLNVLPAEHDLCPLVRETVHEMGQFLRGLVHPDGDISLFNDAAFDGAPNPGSIAEYAGEVGGLSFNECDSDPRMERYSETGYYVYRADHLMLVLDAGAIGPDHQPGHAHADIFSYELSIGNRRLITDSGVYEYRPGALRTYCRSTRAHNTVEVDGIDQAEVWDSFRVGRRFPPVVEEVADSEQGFRFSGRFEGYSNLVGDEIVHRRMISCNRTGNELRVEDRIDGEGLHDVISRIHLHPDVEVRRRSADVNLQRGNVNVELRSSTEIEVRSGWYCPRFGVRRRRSVLTIGGERRLPAEISYELSLKST